MYYTLKLICSTVILMHSKYAWTHGDSVVCPANYWHSPVYAKAFSLEQQLVLILSVANFPECKAVSSAFKCVKTTFKKKQ